jgi:ATP-dependent exoDNAse (exonuclease V) beta subunit
MLWLDEAFPDENKLRGGALREAPELSNRQLDSLLADFMVWVGAPAVRSLFLRTSYPPDARVKTEMPFAVRLGDRVVRGQMDRVVLGREAGAVSWADVVDFKTDVIPEGTDDALHREVDRYRPQLEAYRQALAKLYGLRPGLVTSQVVFLRSGKVVSLSQRL